MKSFFNFLSRELAGYLGFVLGIFLILLFLGASGIHFEPAVSPFSSHFEEPRGWLSELIPQTALQGFGKILFGLAAYAVVMLPAALLLLLVLARCYADDRLPENARDGRDTSWGALFGEMIGTLLVCILLWAPALGFAYSRKWLEGYDLRAIGIEIGCLAVASALLRGLCTRGFRTLFSREVKAAFYSPIAYVVICFLLIATGFDFFYGVRLLNQAPIEATVVQAAFNTEFFWIPMLILAPLITMRTYADEFRMGTFEMVSTAPVRDWEVVGAKFCGALFFYVVLWLPSALYFIFFQFITGKSAALSPGAYGGAYLLILLIGMLYISIGCLCSALTKEQINAVVMSFVVIFGLFALGLIGFIYNITDSSVTALVGYFSSVMHMFDFSRGLIDSRPIVFYLSLTALMLFLNYNVFRYRKWKA